MSERAIPPPRLYVLPARAAPIAVVLRRGPSEWFHVLRWDLETLRVDPGAWFHGTLYPRRSDVSPDGRLLGYFAFTGRPGIWDAYYAISKVPWLTALAAWQIGSTWAAGCEFIDDRTFGIGLAPDTPPDHGRIPEGMRLAPRRWRMNLPFSWQLRDVQNELRRGWIPVEMREDDPILDNVPAPVASIRLVLSRPNPHEAETSLVLAHAGATRRDPTIEGAEVHYVLVAGERVISLDQVSWADWDARGRLLVASRGGTIQVHGRIGEDWTPIWSQDLSVQAPNPTEAPAWAQRW